MAVVERTVHVVQTSVNAPAADWSGDFGNLASGPANTVAARRRSKTSSCSRMGSGRLSTRRRASSARAIRPRLRMTTSNMRCSAISICFVVRTPCRRSSRTNSSTCGPVPGRLGTAAVVRPAGEVDRALVHKGMDPGRPPPRHVSKNDRRRHAPRHEDFPWLEGDQRQPRQADGKPVALQLREFWSLVECPLDEEEWEAKVRERCVDGRNPFLRR